MSAIRKFEYGEAAIYHGDCLSVLSHIPDASVDLIFADPPYNIGKKFGEFKDSWPSEEAYAGWCENWLLMCIDKLTPTGSLYVMTSTQAMPFLDIWLRKRINILSRIIWSYDSSGVQAKNIMAPCLNPFSFVPRI